MTVSSTFNFVDNVRLFKANDPYYWQLDNVPLEQLRDNTRWLKDQVERLSNNGTINRSGFSELKPYSNGTDNVVRVLPGRYSARINDAYNKTPLQKLKLLNEVIGGDIRNYRTDDSFTAEQYNALLSRFWSETGTDSLGLNGLTERVFTWRVVTPDKSLDTVANAFGDFPSTGLDSNIDKSPVVFGQSYSGKFAQSIGAFLDLNRLSAEFCRMWRGVARISIVDISEELSLNVPAFDVNDFKQPIVGGAANSPNAVVRIDLLFIYSHPVDTSSTTIINYTGGQPQTITAPTLGLVKGAGAILGQSANSDLYPNQLTKNINTEGQMQILANVADQYNSDLGFKGLGITGSFPAPDDLLNIAPNLIEDLESNDLQLIGQSILPICYIVVRKNASVNGAGENVVLDSDIIDIRPFFRTAELTYNERAGIAAATPSLSFANPAVGQSQVDYQLNQLKTVLESKLQGVTEQLPRVVAGGTVWGGTQYGPEGAVRLAAKLLAGVADANLPFSEAPTLPDWDIADWWTLYNGTGTGDAANIGSRRNDRVNVQRKGVNQLFDSGTNPTVSTDITTALRRLGNQHFNGSQTNPYCIYWVKKEILIDRSLVPWMNDYSVDCQFSHCLPQTHKSSRSGSAFHDDDSGSAGIWVEKKFDRFFIYAAWLADSPDKYEQDGAVPHGREPRTDRDTYGFSGFIVRHSDMGLPTANNMTYDGVLQSKAPYVGVCTYPTITFKVTGYPDGFYFDSMTQYPQLSLIQLK